MTYQVVLPESSPNAPTILWADPQKVSDLSGCGDFVSSDTAAQAVAAATWVVDSLTGHVYHGAECWVEEYEVTSCCLRLQQSPVDFVASVEQVDSCPPRTATSIGWCFVSAQLLDVCGGCGAGCGSCGSIGCGGCGYRSPIAYGWTYWPGACVCRRVRVNYKIKSNMPPGIDVAVGVLAGELIKSVAGKPCRLPERVTNVTRQGVSWTVLDPQDYLERGLTGLGSVDAFISVANRATPSARMTDPLQGVRCFSYQTTCEGDPFSVSFDTAFDVVES